MSELSDADAFVRQFIVLVAAAVTVHVTSTRAAQAIGRCRRQRQYFRDPARIPTNRTWKQMYAWRTNDQKW